MEPMVAQESIIVLKGFVIGFCLSIPVGPIALLCVRRTLARGLLFGIMSGLGAATADSIFAALSIAGTNYIAQMLVNNQIFLRLGGAVLLIGLGLRAFFASSPRQINIHSEYGLLGSYLTTLALTLSNPVTLFLFTTAFATFNVTYVQSTFRLIFGIFCGSSTWFALISYITNFLRTRMTQTLLARVNRICGLIIALFGFIIFIYTLNCIIPW